MARRNFAQLIELQFTLADTLRATEARHPTLSSALPKPPPGMKWLAPPRAALEARHGDAHTVGIAFSRWLFWRMVLSQRRPTPESIKKAARRLRALALYRLAQRQLEQGGALPVREDAPSPPAGLFTPAPAAPRYVRAAGDPSPNDLDAIINWWDHWG